MGNIKAIIEKLNIGNSIKKLVNREVKIPDYFDDFNSLDSYWYPHPPCLIPIFLGYGASYKGVINHFFCTREVTYTEYFLEHGYISEIARTAEQFITLMVLRMIIVKDGLTDEIIDFCKKLNYNNYEDIDQFTVDYGDDPNDFSHLVFFDRKMPFKYLKDLTQYDGDFPSSLTILNNDDFIQNSCLFELAPIEKLSEIGNLPAWLNSNGNKKALFDQYLSNNDLKGAWFSLNSKGWLLKDVADALEKLKSKANNDLFNLVADNWIDGWKKSTFLNSNY